MSEIFFPQQRAEVESVIKEAVDSGNLTDFEIFFSQYLSQETTATLADCQKLVQEIFLERGYSLAVFVQLQEMLETIYTMLESGEKISKLTKISAERFIIAQFLKLRARITPEETDADTIIFFMIRGLAKTGMSMSENSIRQILRDADLLE